eukprot:Gb_19944 [translate_table: standard]
MAALPDEIWTRIMEAGIQQNLLNYRDLSSIAISSRRLCRLSKQDCLWKFLWSQDFPSDARQGGLLKNVKLLYKSKFERVKSVKIAAHKRSILRVQSQAHVLEKECKNLEVLAQQEKGKMNATLLELKNLERARQSSVALKVWQPQIVRTRQHSVLEQSPIHTDSRIHALKMEMGVCKERIVRFCRSIVSFFLKNIVLMFDVRTLSFK